MSRLAYTDGPLSFKPTVRRVVAATCTDASGLDPIQLAEHVTAIARVVMDARRRAEARRAAA